MINTLAAGMRPTSFRPAVRFDDPTPAPPAPAPDPTPAPVPNPTPDIDFSNIDCPNKASLLPALNGVTFLLTLNSIANAAQGGMALTSALNMTMGASTNASLNYTMADPSTAKLDGTGTIGGQNFQESWELGMNGLLISGTIGQSAEQLALTQGDDGNLHLDGTIGSVDVHQTITNQGDGDDAKLVFDGTVGGQAYHQEVSNKPADPNDPNATAALHCEGTVGSAATSFDEQLSAQDDSSITLDAKGNIAGQPVTINHKLSFAAPADPTPDPTPDPDPDPNPPPSR